MTTVFGARAAEPSEPRRDVANAGRPVTRASDIRKTRLRWTWRGRLALGYLAVWCGAGDIGKSLFAAWVIRGLTRGELDGEFYGEPQNALIVCTEDGREDMWRPRLEAVHADLARVEFLDYPRGWNLKDGISFIDRAITGAGIPLVFIDALMSHMPDPRGGENTRSPVFVRAALQPLADLSAQRKVTSLFGLHPRKAGGETFADVVQESGAFTQLPRIGLLFGYHPDDLELPREQQRRVILRAKGNVGRNPGALSFRIAERFLDWGEEDPQGLADGVAFITDVQPCDVTERQLLHPGPQVDGRPPSKRERAEQLIRMALLDGRWHLAGPIRSHMAELGLNHNGTVGAATARLDVQKRKQPGVLDGAWEWRMDHSFNLGTNRDSSSPARATLDLTLDSSTEHDPIPHRQGRVEESTRFDEQQFDSSKSQESAGECTRETNDADALARRALRHAGGEA